MNNHCPKSLLKISFIGFSLIQKVRSVLIGHLSILSMMAAFLGLGSAKAQAQIIADFTGGNGTSASDQYKGVAGNGWLNAWGTTGIGATLAGTVASGTSSLNKGGNYLSMTATYTSGTLGTGYLGREFSGAVVPVTAPLTYSWTFSTATYNSSTTYNFFDLVGAGGGTGPTSTWGIKETGGEDWSYTAGTGSGGATAVATTMAAVAGDVYPFTINSNPTNDTYSFTIKDMTTGSMYTSPTGIAYRGTAQGKSDGTFLEFGTALSSDSTSFNLANISISANARSGALLLPLPGPAASCASASPSAGEVNAVRPPQPAPAQPE
jgi:hypothetical protein